MERFRRLVFFFFFFFEKWQICFFFLPGVNGLQPFALPCAGRSERIKWGPEKKRFMDLYRHETNGQIDKPNGLVP